MESLEAMGGDLGFVPRTRGAFGSLNKTTTLLCREWHGRARGLLGDQERTAEVQGSQGVAEEMGGFCLLGTQLRGRVMRTCCWVMGGRAESHGNLASGLRIRLTSWG